MLHVREEEEGMLCASVSAFFDFDESKQRFILYKDFVFKDIVRDFGFANNNLIFYKSSMFNDSCVPDIKDRTNSAN